MTIQRLLEAHIKLSLIEIDKSPNKGKILLLLLYEGEKTISQIQRELKLNYKTIWEHVRSLEKKQLVTLNKKEKEAGKPVYVRFNNFLETFGINEKDFKKQIRKMKNENEKAN